MGRRRHRLQNLGNDDVMSSTVSRRMILQAGIAAGAGFLLSGRLATAEDATLASGTAATEATAINSWVRIAADNTVTLIASQSEMGQGISTTLAVALADELGVDWKRVTIEFAPYDEAYRHPRNK